MAIPDAQTYADKWVSRTSAAATDYQRGVEQTTKDPTQLAIAQQQRMLINVQDAINSGKWARRLSAVGKAGWQQAVLSKGVNNFSSGVVAARDKVAEKIAPLLAYEASLQRTVLAMPATTDADREARMLAWIRGMRQYGSA